jgi:hypothetical protein
MKQVYIYALIDPRNGQIRYIGKANNPNERYKNHFNSARDKNTHKRNWINSIRKDGFRPELLIIDCVNIVEWQYWEKFYVSLYKYYGFDLLNYTAGGDGTTFGNDGSFKKGNIPHNKGVSCTQEKKNKISKSLIGFISDYNKSKSKKIIQYDINYNLINKYASISEAAKSNELFDRKKISECCSLKRKQHRNYIWKFDDGILLIKEKIKLLNKNVVQYNKQMIEINRFSSIKEAENETKVFSSNITSCCKFKVKSAGGYIWRYC